MGRQANLRVQVLGVLAVAVDGREVPPKELARTYGSTKALALACLGRRPEALELAAASGSDYLIAQVAPPAQARAAMGRSAAALPAELRPAFLRHGFLARTAAKT
jgi:hypothetical protein